MDEFSRRRWDKEGKPREHNPITALHAALAKFEEFPDEKPDHIIVVFGRHCEDGADGTTFFQAGTYSHHAQMGLLDEGKSMIRESGT